MSQSIKLVALPSLPSSRKSGPLATCECGCGGATRSRFVQGHDSRLAGWIRRVAAGVKVDGVGILAYLDKVSPGEAAAVRGAIKARTLPHIKWDVLFPLKADAPKVG